VNVTAYQIAARFIGTKETAGSVANPAILAMLRLDNPGVHDDETPWCSAFVNWVAWLLRLPRSKSLRARSWLGVGEMIAREECRVGFDVIVLSRGPLPQPGSEVLEAPGHVGFFGGFGDDRVPGLLTVPPVSKVWLLGGNQGDQVSLASFPIERVLGYRRLYGGAT
jgi:uncharacterized protein (TIGR02594 family)